MRYSLLGYHVQNEIFLKEICTEKTFCIEEENNCEEEIDLTPQDGIANIDWCKCGSECKPMATFAESFCLLLRLKSRSAMGASHHSAFMDDCPIISHTC